MTHDEAVRLIRASDLRAHADELVEMLSPSVRLSLGVSGTKPPMSWFGGTPRLPRGLSWPTWDRSEYLTAEIARMEEQYGKNSGMRSLIEARRDELTRPVVALPFLCQLDMGEIAAAAALPHLPYDGSLAFFCDTDNAVGFDPLAKGSCSVLHFPSTLELVRAETPSSIEEHSQFDEKPLACCHEWTLPSWPPTHEREFRWDSKEHEELCEQVMPAVAEGPVHRCGGHPQEVQGDMRLLCQLVSNGIYCGGLEGYRDPRRKALEAGMADWELLLQLDTDDGVPWMWGDSGRVYFWARRQEIEALDFEGARAEMQCY